MDDNYGYPSPPGSPSSTESSVSVYSFRLLRLVKLTIQSSGLSLSSLDEVTPFDSISQSGREGYETAEHLDLPAPVFEDHGRANLVLTASSVSSRSISSDSLDSLFSSVLAAKDPVYGLPFVKRCANIDSLPHFKLTLK